MMGDDADTLDLSKLRGTSMSSLVIRVLTGSINVDDKLNFQSADNFSIV